MVFLPAADFLPTLFFFLVFFLVAIGAVYHPIENGKALPICTESRQFRASRGNRWRNEPASVKTITMRAPHTVFSRVLFPVYELSGSILTADTRICALLSPELARNITVVAGTAFWIRV